VGDSHSFGATSFDVYLVKTDAQGEMQWETTFGSTEFDYGASVRQTDDEGFIICGATTARTGLSSDVYLIKTDSDGDVEWETIVGGPNHDNGSSVIQARDGGYLVAGETESYGERGLNAYLMMTSGEGELMWEKTFGGPNDDFARSVIETSGHAYLFAGSTACVGGFDCDLYLVAVEVAE
jgi:hypothetical protein